MKLTASRTTLTTILTTTLVSIFCLSTTGQGLAQALNPVNYDAYVPGEILLQFASTVTDAQIAEAFRRGALNLVEHVRTPAMEDHGKIGLTRTITTLPVEAAVRALANLPGVEFAEPNWIVTAQGVSNDPLYLDGSLWGMMSASSSNPSGTQADTAWAAGFTGSSDVYVGVLDGGIQADHEDLAANIWTNPGEIPGNGIDDDGDGYVDDVHGYDTADNIGSISNDPHPTHVAGVIGAVGGNGIGVAGVNWKVTMISGQIFGTNGTFAAVQGVDYMTALKTRKGLNIVAVNNSWSIGGFSQSLLDAFGRSAQAGILSIVSAANSTNNNDVIPGYPSSFDTTAYAGYDAVIAVAAVTRDGNLATYSNYGRTNVDLGAPGGQYFNPTHYPDLEIISCVPTNSYAPMRGTSMAAPHVTGAVVLYASTHPGSSPAQTRYDLLTSGVRPLAALSGITVTGGTLDIGNLMTVPANALATPNSPTSLQAIAGAGGRVDLKWADQSANELGFAIERSNGGQPYVLVGTIGANYTNYSDWTVSPNTSYSYRIRAYNSGGSSSYSNSGSVNIPSWGLPTAPTSLTAGAQPKGGVALAWADKSSNEGGFLIERRFGAAGTWQPLVTVAANTAKYTDSTTVWRTTYYYRVRAYNIAGNSATSNEISVTAK